MRIRIASKVNERIWYLGRMESGMYLLSVNGEAMLISAGLSCILEDVLAQMAAFGISGNMKRGLTRLFMTHPPLEERIEALRAGR